MFAYYEQSIFFKLDTTEFCFSIGAYYFLLDQIIAASFSIFSLD